jgi:hypothetical protein
MVLVVMPRVPVTCVSCETFGDRGASAPSRRAVRAHSIVLDRDHDGQRLAKRGCVVATNRRVARQSAARRVAAVTDTTGRLHAIASLTMFGEPS